MENVACSLKPEGEVDDLNWSSEEQSDSSSPVGTNSSVEGKLPSVFSYRSARLYDTEEIPELELYFRTDDLLDESPISDPKFLLEGDEPPLDEEAQRALDSMLQNSGLAQMVKSVRDGTFVPEKFEKYTAPVRAALDAAGAAVRRMRAEENFYHVGDKTDKTLELSDNVELETWINEELGIRPEKMSADEKAQARIKLSEVTGINEVTARGETLLWLSCAYGYHDVAEFLVSMKADIESRGVKGTTPLMVAATNGHSSIVKLLIEHGADVNAGTHREYLKKPASARSERVDEEDTNTRIMSIIYPEGTTPLMYACSQGHLDVVSILLEADAKVEDRNVEGRTALMEAARAKRLEIVKFLISHGANLNARRPDVCGNTAFILACSSGELELVSFLLESGAVDHGHKVKELKTALLRTASRGHIEVARLLLNTGAQLNEIGSDVSPLLAAVRGGQVEMARFLLKEGANIEKFYTGLTPLMEAVREGDKDMVKLLLSHGANINARTGAGDSILSLAATKKREEFRELLSKAGAKS